MEPISPVTACPIRAQAPCLSCASFDRIIEDQPLSSGKNASISWCVNCGFGRRLDIHSPDQLMNLQIEMGGRRSAKYGTQIRSYPNPWYSTNRLFSQRLKSFLRSDDTILDVGCGIGDWLECFSGHCDTFGIECSPESADIAERRGARKIYRFGYAEHEIDQRFTVISAIAVIEHLYDPRGFLEWCRGHLKPDGVLVLMTGDASSGVARRMGKGWPLAMSDDHINYFTSQSMQTMLGETGFHNVELSWRLSVFHRPWMRPLRYVAKLLEIIGISKIKYFDLMYVIARDVNDKK